MHKLTMDICDAVHLDPNCRPKVSMDYSYEPTSSGLVKKEFKVTRVKLMNTDRLCNEINKMRFGECYRLYHEFTNDYQIFAAIDGRTMYIMHTWTICSVIVSMISYGRNWQNS